MPSATVVSKHCIRCLTNDISFLAFSIITMGSMDGHLKKLGAKTVAKFESSILVTWEIWVWANNCRNRIRYIKTKALRSGNLETKADNLEKKNACLKMIILAFYEDYHQRLQNGYPNDELLRIQIFVILNLKNWIFEIFLFSLFWRIGTLVLRLQS